MDNRRGRRPDRVLKLALYMKKKRRRILAIYPVGAAKTDHMLN
jgi:hypothetical protein